MCVLGFPTVLGQNSVMSQFGGGAAEGSKTQNFLLFKPIDKKLKIL